MGRLFVDKVEFDPTKGRGRGGGGGGGGGGRVRNIPVIIDEQSSTKISFPCRVWTWKWRISA